ncbi:hypothetical protein ACFYT4_27020 [Streptomyces sp. NPDC004609]|uniref:hypothetical protein n=1 Tax=Streptomyces sp. NPDC004609 TaxID=3364704 RepID=UPI0036972D5C
MDYRHSPPTWPEQITREYRLALVLPEGALVLTAGSRSAPAAREVFERAKDSLVAKG